MKNKLSGIIIDDDEDLLEVTSMFLELKGIAVKGTGYNGCDADRLYQQTHPDFVLLDMKMPDYDGAYAIKKIKAYDPNAKIFVLTGYIDYPFEKDKVEQIFPKPYDIKKLVAEIMQAC
ncbi:MAG: response regulator [Thaumarchaeota archaeon]|nr:response regulator [Nitrososphaerota archaeon]